jgi:hypothetical protein
MKKFIFHSVLIGALLLNVNAFANDKSHVGELFRGTVVETQQNGAFAVKNQFGQIVHFNANENLNYNVGASVAVAYEPQTRKVLLVTRDAVGSFAEIGVLDNDFVSSNGSRFDYDENVVVYDAKGKLYSGSLESKNALIFSNGSSFVKKIVVLGDANPSRETLARDAYAKLAPESRARFEKVRGSASTFYNFSPLSNDYIKTETGVLAPLREVAEKMNLDLRFNPDTGMFSVNDTYYALINHNSVAHHNKIDVFNSDFVIQNDRIYAPIEFFSETLGINAYMLGDKVLIYQNKL